MPWSDLIIVPVSHHSTNWSPRSLCGSLLPMKAPLLWTSTHPPATHLVSLSWLEVAYAPVAQNTITSELQPAEAGITVVVETPTDVMTSPTVSP